ncbi:DUF624 domain-containing protein [Patescibacteria group bacterium]|nr:DUF624 domain-containing protein [Patescibacteria group bacterium]
MDSYFNKYWRHFVAGMILGLIFLIIWIITEVFK